MLKSWLFCLFPFVLSIFNLNAQSDSLHSKNKRVLIGIMVGPNLGYRSYGFCGSKSYWNNNRETEVPAIGNTIELRLLLQYNKLCFKAGLGGAYQHFKGHIHAAYDPTMPAEYKYEYGHYYFNHSLSLEYFFSTKNTWHIGLQEDISWLYQINDTRSIEYDPPIIYSRSWVSHPAQRKLLWVGASIGRSTAICKWLILDIELKMKYSTRIISEMEPAKWEVHASDETVERRLVESDLCFTFYPIFKKKK